MKRREFMEKAGIGSAAFVTMPALGDAAAKAGGKETAKGEAEHAHGGHDDDIQGPLANATVSFGAWETDPPIDRFPNNSPRDRNHHHLMPSETTIKAGGSVNFIISGFHHLLVYGDGTKPEDINRTLLVAPTTQPVPPLINDPTNRVYRGLDPSVLPQLPGSTPTQPLQDRVEVVRFPNKGRYLVMCGVLPHFFDAPTGQFLMFGYVRVL
jgi:hypothetical protein